LNCSEDDERTLHKLGGGGRTGKKRFGGRKLRLLYGRKASPIAVRRKKRNPTGQAAKEHPDAFAKPRDS